MTVQLPDATRETLASQTSTRSRCIFEEVPRLESGHQADWIGESYPASTHLCYLAQALAWCRTSVLYCWYAFRCSASRDGDRAVASDLRGDGSSGGAAPVGGDPTTEPGGGGREVPPRPSCTTPPTPRHHPVTRSSVNRPTVNRNPPTAPTHRPCTNRTHHRTTHTTLLPVPCLSLRTHPTKPTTSSLSDRSGDALQSWRSAATRPCSALGPINARSDHRDWASARFRS